MRHHGGLDPQPPSIPWRRLVAEVDGDRYVATVYEGRRNWSAHVRRLPGLAVAGPYVHGSLDLNRTRRKLAQGIGFHLEGLAIDETERVQDRGAEPAAIGSGPSPSSGSRGGSSAPPRSGRCGSRSPAGLRVLPSSSSTSRFTIVQRIPVASSRIGGLPVAPRRQSTRTKEHSQVQRGLAYWAFIPAATRGSLHPTLGCCCAPPTRSYSTTRASGTYQSATQLQPGQGAWAYSADGGDITFTPRI